MSYDTAGNMSRYIAKEGDTITATQENVYNGNGQRIRKTEADKTTNYYYQGSNVLYTTDADENLTAQNLIGISENTIATTRGTGEEEKYYIYNKDIRESTTNVVDSNGKSEVSYEYTDYGETEITGNKDFYNEICYTGGIYDETTGIYYLNARYYDPETANFLSQDSYRGEALNPASLNYYTYCYGNPITYTDPSGHIPILVVVAVKVGGRIILKQVAKKAAKKVVKKAVKKGVAKAAGKSLKVVKQTKKLKKATIKPKASKKYLKAAKKTNKKSRYKVNHKSTAKKKVSAKRDSHGNSANSKKEQHGYEIYSVNDGDVVKTGISGGKITKKGKSYRATTQVNKFNREAKAKGSKKRYDSRIVVKLPDRAKALKWEKLNANRLKKKNSMIKHRRP